MARHRGTPLACGSGDSEDVPACLGEGSDDDICVLRVMRPSVYKLSRVNVPGDLAKVLDPDIDEKGKSVIAINAAASHPKDALPAQCNLGHRQKKTGASERFVDGLNPYLRANKVEPDLDLVLMSSVAPAASASSDSSSSRAAGAAGAAADRDQLSIRVIRDGDLPAATLYNLRTQLGKGQAWVGRRADLPAFIAWAARQPLPADVDTTAAGAVPLQRKKPERQPKAAPKPERPEEAAERIRRRREQQQRVIAEGSERLMTAGLSEVDVQAVAAWRAAGRNRRVVRTLTERAFRYGKVNVPSEFAQLFVPPWTPGVKPEPVQVKANTVSYSELLPYVTFRGSPRERHDGYIEWTVQGLGKWLKGSGGEAGDALLEWVEEEQQEDGKVVERLHLHLLKMGTDASGVVAEELGSS